MSDRSGDRSEAARLLLYLLTIATLLIGVLLMLVRNQISDSPSFRDTILQFGSGLAIFGFTTLLVTVFVNNILERQLVDRVNEQLGQHATEVMDTLRRNAEAVERSLTDLNPLIAASKRLGLVNVYLTRTDAFADFAYHIQSELDHARSVPPDPTGATSKARLWIVASSMKGIREIAVDEFNGEELLVKAAQLTATNQLDIRILLTHPHYANLRAAQEQRRDGAIPEEIDETLRFLNRSNVPVGGVRLVNAMPTVFAIATQREMLLNPYPYSAEGLRSFALRVRKVHQSSSGQVRDIYEQYEQRHFVVPWDKGISLDTDYSVPKTGS